MYKLIVNMVGRTNLVIKRLEVRSNYSTASNNVVANQGKKLRL